MTTLKLLNGSQVAHVGTVTRMGEVAGLVYVQCEDGLYEAWDIEKIGDDLCACSWKRAN